MAKAPSPLEKEYKRIGQRYLCAHENEQLTRLVTAGGTVQYRKQCLTCGRNGEALSRRALLEQQIPLEALPLNDPALSGKWYDKQREEFARAANADREQKNRDWQAWYAEYLESTEWMEKRRKVMMRCRGYCEGCGSAPATVVHHLTYAHVGHELLWELVGVCQSCHDLCHAGSEKQ